MGTANEGVASRGKEKFWINPATGKKEPKREFAFEFPGFCRKLLERGEKLSPKELKALEGLNEPEQRDITPGPEVPV